MTTSKIAYLMSWFPARTETFILYEIIELERRGLSVEIYPVLGKKSGAPHPEAVPLIARTNYRAFLSAKILRANWHWLRTSPLRYLSVLFACVVGNLRSIDFLAKALFVFPKAALIAWELQQKGVERVHAHWATHPTLAAFVIKGLTGIPYSFTAHAHDLYVDRTMLRQKLEAAEGMVTISDYNRRLIRGWYGEAAEKKVSVIRCGIDSSVFKPKTEEQTKKNHLFTAVCIASLRDYKGHAYLIEACKLLKARGKSPRVLLIGDGEDRAKIEEQIARAGLSETVHLLGHQTRDRVSELLGEADMAVQPSIVTANGKMEGIPVALMEALACEVPVVATNISGISELVRHETTGLLVPEKDSKALADAMERVMNNPSLARKLAQAGRELVLREFDLKRNAARLHAMLTGAELPVIAEPKRSAAVRQQQHTHGGPRAEA